MDEKRKTSLEKMVATELLKLAMETEEERKERLKKMVANVTSVVLFPPPFYFVFYISNLLSYIQNNFKL